ncbi:MAG: zf-HC2 domain-containing protein [Terriglobia bacterium]|jgi:anti-sigma factor ChrR (cupin superfamily)
MSKNACPNDDELFQFVDNELESQEQKVVEAHLVGCAVCRRKVVEFGAVTTIVADAIHTYHDRVCPAPDTLWEFASASTDEKVSSSVKEHVKSCPKCSLELQLAEEAVKEAEEYNQASQQPASLRNLALQMSRTFISEKHHEEVRLLDGLRNRIESLVDSVLTRPRSRWSLSFLSFEPAVAFARGTGRLPKDLATPTAPYVVASVLRDWADRKTRMREQDLRKLIGKYTSKSKCNKKVAQELEDYLVERLRASLT